MDSGSRGRKRPAADVDEEIPEEKTYSGSRGGPSEEIPEKDKEKLLSQSTSDSELILPGKPPPYVELPSDEEIPLYDSSYEEPPSDEEIPLYDSSYEEPPSGEEIPLYDSSYEEPPSDEEIPLYDFPHEEPPSGDLDGFVMDWSKDLCVDLEDNEHEKDFGATAAAPAPVESSRPPLSSDKRNSNRKTELKLPEITEIDGDTDSDDEDDQCISYILKRKRCSKEIKKEGNSDDNDK